MFKRIFVSMLFFVVCFLPVQAQAVEPVESLIASALHDAREAQLKTYETGLRLLIEARNKLLRTNLSLDGVETGNYIDNRTWFQRAHPHCFQLRWFNYKNQKSNSFSVWLSECEQFQGTPIRLEEYTFSPITTDVPWDEKKIAAYEAAYLILFANDIFQGINFPSSIWKYSNGVNILIKDAQAIPPQCYVHVVDPHETNGNPPDHIVLNTHCDLRPDSSFLLILQ